MTLFDIYLLAGTAFILLGCVVLFNSTVDGRRPTSAIVILLVGFGCIYGASSVSAEGLSLSDLPAALGKLVKTLVR